MEFPFFQDLEVDPIQKVFESGLEALQKNDYSGAHRHFKEAYFKGTQSDFFPAVQSYFGYTLGLVERKDSEAIQLMHLAVRDIENSLSKVYEPDVFLNLGKFYLGKRSCRKKGIYALMKGLDRCPADSRILTVIKKIGIRRSPALPFLSRGNFLNRLIGKWTWRKKNPSTKSVPLRLNSRNHRLTDPDLFSLNLFSSRPARRSRRIA
jgi:hypothetical protein